MKRVISKHSALKTAALLALLTVGAPAAGGLLLDEPAPVAVARSPGAAPVVPPVQLEQPFAAKLVTALPVRRNPARRRSIFQRELRATASSDAKASARRALARRDAALAYQLLRAEVASEETDVELLGLLAVAALATQRFEAAEVLYRHLLGLQQRSAHWWMGLALARGQRGLTTAEAERKVLAFAEPDSLLYRYALTTLRDRVPVDRVPASNLATVLPAEAATGSP